MSNRFGNLENGVHDIKGHHWFHSIDWELLFLQGLKPPFLPRLFGEADTTNYKKYIEEDLKIGETENFGKEFENF